MNNKHKPYRGLRRISGPPSGIHNIHRSQLVIEVILDPSTRPMAQKVILILLYATQVPRYATGKITEFAGHDGKFDVAQLLRLAYRGLFL